MRRPYRQEDGLKQCQHASLPFSLLSRLSADVNDKKAMLTLYLIVSSHSVVVQFASIVSPPFLGDLDNILVILSG